LEEKEEVYNMGIEFAKWVCEEEIEEDFKNEMAKDH